MRVSDVVLGIAVVTAVVLAVVLLGIKETEPTWECYKTEHGEACHWSPPLIR